MVIGDRDPWMSAFWRVMGGKSSQAEELASLVEKTVPTIEMFVGLRAAVGRDFHAEDGIVVNASDTTRNGDLNGHAERPALSEEEAVAVVEGVASAPRVGTYGIDAESEVGKAFLAVFFNRTTFSGILTSGPIGGYAQSSAYPVGCRYNGRALASKIRACHASLSGRTTVLEADFADTLALTGDGLAYVDPPYYEQGNSLYRCGMTHGDHVRLARVLEAADYPWTLSYDEHPEVRALYEPFAAVESVAAWYSVTGKNSKGRPDTSELIISKL